MTRFMIPVAALAVGLTCLASGAMARETPNQTTKRLNQQQAMNVPSQSTGSPRMANEAYGPSKVSTGMNDAAVPQPEQAPQEVYVVGAAHTAMDATREPDTNPQSYGTPSIDTPFLTTVQAKK